MLIVDGDDEHRTQLGALLAADGFNFRGAGSGDEGLARALQERPRLALIEINIAGMCGYELLRRLRDVFGDGLPVVFMSGERTESFDRVAGMLLGADDYVSKPFAPDELLARIRRLIHSSSPTLPPRAATLTARERDVLELLAAGNSQPEIADALEIAPKTCGKHIERILEKLDVHSRAQAVAVAYRDDLLAVRH